MTASLWSLSKISKNKVSIQLTRLFLHGGVATVLKASRIGTYAPVFRSSRLATKKNPGKLNRYKINSLLP